MTVRILPPPAQVPLAHGVARGGIFDAPWLPADFIGPGYAPLPVDSSTPQPVAPSVVSSPMGWGSTMPTGFGQVFEMVGPAPLRIEAYQPLERRFRGGIFAGMGQIAPMRRARPEWTRWQMAALARRGW